MNELINYPEVIKFMFSFTTSAFQNIFAGIVKRNSLMTN